MASAVVLGMEGSDASAIPTVSRTTIHSRRFLALVHASSASRTIAKSWSGFLTPLTAGTPSHDSMTAVPATFSVALDKELDAAFPRQRAARVSITARGRTQEHLQPTRIGDPDAPLSDAQLEEKYLELAVPVIGEGKAKSLLQRLWKLEAEKSLAS